MSFVATRSGLTRTRVFDESPRIKKLAKLFIERHGRAVDEAWYARTVDWSMRFSEDATIISVAYNAYVRLIAKLRQRITQRHPAVNDTRSNCDQSLLDELQEAGSGAEATGEQTGTEGGGGEQQQQAAERVRRSEPSGAETEPASTAADLQDQAQPRAESEPGQQANGTAEQTEPPEINYNEYSSFDFLDLLANSSVHVAAFQPIIVNRAKRQTRTPLGVTGHLYDYASFARRFLNATSLNIRTYDQPAGQYEPQSALPIVKVDICPNGECPTRCGLRNDTIDCLLVDNNGFIVVGEELPHIGRPLADYDNRLMQSLVDKRVFHPVQIVDYQAICARNEQQANAELQQQRPGAVLAASSGAANLSAMLLAVSSSAGESSAAVPKLLSLELARSLLANLAAGLVWTATRLYSAFLLRSAVDQDPSELFGDESLIGRLHQWQRSALMAEAQSASANQSLLALLPNKTYLRPCERTSTLYESRPYEPSKIHSDSPEYYVTRCGCSGWYVYDAVPKTNLIMLIVNTTSACRRCADQPVAGASPLAPLVDAPLGPAKPAGGNAAEEQVCSMLERDQPLYVQRPASCMTSHPDESQIHICGSAARAQPSGLCVLLPLLVAIVVRAALGWLGTGPSVFRLGAATRRGA
jgi:hypothetical protein